MADDTNWNHRPFVTATELTEMQPSQRAWFTNQPNIWRPAVNADVLMNCAHPDNAQWAVEDMVREVMANG